MAATTASRILLRDMAHRDIRAVRHIESAAYQDAWPSRIFENELENDFAHYRVLERVEPRESPSGVLPALRRALGRGRAGDRILGFMGVWYMMDQLHLVTIAVDPADQGRGIGQRLLLDCFDLAREAELGEIVLEVRESNQRARDLYQYFGFRQAGVLKDYYKDNHEDAVVMLSGPLDTPEAIARLDSIRAALREAHPALFEG